MSELDDLSRIAAERLGPDRAGPTWTMAATGIIADVFRPLAERAAKMEAMLRRLEWLRNYNTGEHKCPVCFDPRELCHGPDCELAALLASAPSPSPPEAGGFTNTTVNSVALAQEVINKVRTATLAAVKPAVPASEPMSDWEHRLRALNWGFRDSDQREFLAELSRLRAEAAAERAAREQAEAEAAVLLVELRRQANFWNQEATSAARDQRIGDYDEFSIRERDVMQILRHSTAGRALLDRVKKLEAVANAAKAWTKTGDVGYGGWSEKYDELLDTLADLDAKGAP